MANSDVRLTLWSLNNFRGRRIHIRRGGIAVRDLGAFRFDNALSSFRLRNVVNSNDVTLVIFSRINFRGTFRVYRGNRSVSNLSNANFNNVTSSLILVGRILSDSDIRQIQTSGNPPRDIVVVRQ